MKTPMPTARNRLDVTQSDHASDSGAGDDLKALLHELHAEQENAQAADYVKTHIQYQINVHNGTVKLVSL